MTPQHYTYPVADATLAHSEAVLAIDEVMHRLGFQEDGSLVNKPGFAQVHDALFVLYAAIESARPSPLVALPDPVAAAVAIARDAAAEAGALDSLDDEAADEYDDDDDT